MMNERIQELVEQAYEQKPLMVLNPETYEIEHKIGNGGVPMYHRVFNQEKFAELIVREYAALAKSKSERIQSMETDDRGDQMQIQSLAWQFEEFGYAIKKHFGVEE